MKFFFLTLLLSMLYTLAWTQKPPQPALVWVIPSAESSNTTVREFELSACIRQAIPPFTVKVYLNDIAVLTKGGLNIVDEQPNKKVRNCKTTFRQKITLQNGANRLTVQLTDKNGTATIYRKINYSQPAPLKKPTTNERRKALVIGNAAYWDMSRLDNCLNDADSMANALRALSFQVTMLKDGNKDQILQVIDTFCKDLSMYDVALFYYSGHGFEARSLNCILPTDAASLTAEYLLKHFSISSGKGYAGLSDKFLNSGVPKTIFILDACRNNPLEDTLAFTFNHIKKNLPVFKASTDGITIPVNKEQGGSGGSCIAYATRAGYTADGAATGLNNSPYTYALLKNFRRVNMPISEMLNNVQVTLSKVASQSSSYYYDLPTGFIMFPYDETQDEQSTYAVNNHDKSAKNYDGVIRDIRIDTDVTEAPDSLKGIRFHIDFEVARMLNANGRVSVEFFEEDLTPIADADLDHGIMWVGGKLALESEFTSRNRIYSNEDLTKGLFVSYSDFGSALKGKKIFYKIQVIVNDIIRLSRAPQAIQLPNKW